MPYQQLGKIGRPERYQLQRLNCNYLLLARECGIYPQKSARADLLARNYSAKPSHVGNEMNLPASDGILLTTGNLEDVIVSELAWVGRPRQKNLIQVQAQGHLSPYRCMGTVSCL